MSVSPAGIKGSASQMNTLTAELRKVSQELRATYNESASYWTGAASNSFRGGYDLLDSELKAVLRSLERLEGIVVRVSTEVRRADEERAEKRRMAERLVAEAALKQKSKK